MIAEIEQLPFDQLRTLHREIGALIAQKRHEALDQLRAQMEVLGFTPEDFAPPRKKRGRKPKQQEEDETETA
jgi:hypothetical protein